MPEVKNAVLKLVIIDEVSMCSAKMLDSIEEKMSLIRKNSGAFGGFSIVLFGDLLQIPPVEAEWVFKSKWWHSFEYAELQINLRQLLDPEFSQMLQRWRVGKINDADRLFLQKKCVVSKGPPRYFDRVSDTFIKIEKGDSLVLTHRNASASEINKRVIKTKFGAPLSSVSTVYHRIVKENVCERILVNEFQIACGTKVMINENLPCGLRNGEIARIVEIHADKNQNVERVDLMPTSSHIVQTVHRRVKRRDVGTNERQAKLYLPFIPAYAATFHKAQGQTLDRVVLELSASKMDAGLFFVGASRVRCGDDFYITNYHKNFQIKVNTEARDEYNRLRLLINLPPI
ncbi:hypothetical protein CAEBREN_18268 [Caenorhabditis brenneri]|uniref:ATP-dependent DNA helicase n=1 Tax=Caenorhabditis brenneri TaxID=135651 RepID=G0NY74_CAEBE|nr:hypothetical protein CAEBREN_18268 [Caenorhabditis brenneri]